MTGDIVEEKFQINDISDQCHSLAASTKKEKQDEVNQTFVPSKWTGGLLQKQGFDTVMYVRHSQLPWKINDLWKYLFKG